MPYVKKEKMVSSPEDEGKQYDDIPVPSDNDDQNLVNVKPKRKWTPEELKQFRLDNLKKAREMAKGIYDAKREEKKRLAEEEKAKKEEIKRLAQEHMEKRKQFYEKRVAVLDAENQRLEKKTGRLKKETELIEPEAEPIVEKEKPVKSKKKVIYITDSESSDEEEVIVRRKKKPSAPAPMPVMPQIINPLEEMSNRQIRDEMRKIQLEMLAKQLWV